MASLTQMKFGIGEISFFLEIISDMHLYKCQIAKKKYQKLSQIQVSIIFGQIIYQHSKNRAQLAIHLNLAPMLKEILLEWKFDIS